MKRVPLVDPASIADDGEFIVGEREPTAKSRFNSE